MQAATMEDPAPGRFAGALALLVLAGAIDATAFVRLGGVFVSFMSGDTTQAAAALGSGRPVVALTLLGVVGAFTLGVVIGDLVADDPPRHPARVLTAEAALVAAAAAAPAPLALPILALAMGMHNALVLRGERVGLALTYVTGTLVHFGRGLAARLRGNREAPVWPYAAMWTALVSGGTTGGLLAASGGAYALPVLAGLLLAAAAVVGVMGSGGRGR